MRRTREILLITAILAIASLSLTSCGTMAGSRTRTTTTVAVSGTGTVYLDADMVTFNINVSETAGTTAEAQQLANRKISAILQILKDHGIAEEDISTTALNFSPEYYWDGGKQIKTGESVSQSVYVTMHDIQGFSTLADDLGTMLSGIQLYSVSFDSSKKAEAGVKARELAYQNAMEKALQYAHSAGLEISRPIEISEGYASFATASYKMSDAARMGAAAPEAMYETQVQSGLISASIDVSVTFELN